jgi:hypothetical protein
MDVFGDRSFDRESASHSVDIKSTWFFCMILMYSYKTTQPDGDPLPSPQA